MSHSSDDLCRCLFARVIGSCQSVECWTALSRGSRFSRMASTVCRSGTWGLRLCGVINQLPCQLADRSKTTITCSSTITPKSTTKRIQHYAGSLNLCENIRSAEWLDIMFLCSVTSELYNYGRCLSAYWYMCHLQILRHTHIFRPRSPCIMNKSRPIQIVQ